MPKLKPWMIIPGALVVAGIAGAGTASQPITHTPEQIVQARQASFDMSTVTMAEMGHAVKDGLPLTKQSYPANALGRWARVLPTMFPAGTGADSVSIPTRAKAEIWTDRTGFEKAAADYAAAADKLRDLAKAGDTAGFSAQLDVVDKACDACHDKYRSK